MARMTPYPTSYSTRYIPLPKPPEPEERMGAGGIPKREPPRKLGMLDLFPEWLGRVAKTGTLIFPREPANAAPSLGETVVLGVDPAGPQGDYTAGTLVESPCSTH